MLAMSYGLACQGLVQPRSQAQSNSPTPNNEGRVQPLELCNLDQTFWSDPALLFTVATLKWEIYQTSRHNSWEKWKLKCRQFWTLISNHWLVSLLTDLRGEERRETDLGILLYFYDFTQNSSSPPIKLERFKVTTNNQYRRNVCIETWKRKHKI